MFKIKQLKQTIYIRIIFIKRLFRKYEFLVNYTNKSFRQASVNFLVPIYVTLY